MDGILLVDKPRGFTSHDVVAKVRGILRKASSHQSLVTSNKQLVTRESKIRVGHTGTLDPAATGLLILVLGAYTKRAGEFSKLDKTYEAEITLGATSSTGDREGEITEDRRQKAVDWEKPSRGAVEAVLGQFVGKISQTPHIYSAIKVGGQRAYKMARQGQEVKLEPREVTIYSLQPTVYRYPKLHITARVSSGTYIRSLAEDIGEKLGTGAYLSDLRRTSVGEHNIDKSVNLEDIDSNTLASKLEQGL